MRVKKIKAKTYKRPDLNKPRFRDTKFSKNLISAELYEEWIKENPKYADKVTCYGDFLKIWNKISEKYRHYAVNNSMGVKLPFYCGELSVEYVNIEYEAINEKLSYDNDSPVPHLNWNSSDKLGKLIWCIKRAMAFNGMLPFTAFKGCSTFITQAKNGLKNNPQIYKTAKSV